MQVCVRRAKDCMANSNILAIKSRYTCDSRIGVWVAILNFNMWEFLSSQLQEMVEFGPKAKLLEMSRSSITYKGCDTKRCDVKIFERKAPNEGNDNENRDPKWLTVVDSTMKVIIIVSDTGSNVTLESWSIA